MSERQGCLFTFSIALLNILLDYTQNPFASSHSLDTNPFDDPPQRSASAAEQARLEELRRREQDLERREAELNVKADNLRRNGRNNFPPCTSLQSGIIPIPLMGFQLCTSLPFNFPLHQGRDTTGFPAFDHPAISALAGSRGYTSCQYDCMYLYTHCWCRGWWKRPGFEHWVSAVDSKK